MGAIRGYSYQLFRGVPGTKNTLQGILGSGCEASLSSTCSDESSVFRGSELVCYVTITVIIVALCVLVAFIVAPSDATLVPDGAAAAAVVAALLPRRLCPLLRRPRHNLVLSELYDSRTLV